MLTINQECLHEVSGGKMHFGAMVSSMVVGFVAGGPIGLGFAVSGIIMTQGINNLHDLYTE